MPGQSIRIGGVYADIRARNEQFLRAANQNVVAIRRQRSALRTLNRTAESTRRSFGRLSAVAFAGFGTALTAGIGGGLAQVGRQSAQLGASLVETSRQIGITTESLQLLGRVAEGDGVSIRNFENSLRQLARRLGEASTGQGEYVDSFRGLGIALRDAQGATRDVGDVFLEAADAIAALPTQADRAIAAYELFGRQGIQLLPILQQGSEAIQESAEAFRQFGILTADQAVRLKALEQSYTNTGTVIRTAIAQITADNAELFDSFNRLAQDFVPAAFGGLVRSLEFLRQNMVAVRAGASLLVATLLRSLGVFRAIGAAMRIAASAFAGFTASAAAARLALAAFLRLFILTGIGAAVIAIGELAFQFLRLSRQLGGFGPALRLVGRGFREIGQQIAATGRGIRAVLASIELSIFNAFAETYDRVINSTRRFAVDFANTIIRAVNQAIEAINSIGGNTFRIIPEIDAPALVVSVTREAQSIRDAFNSAFEGLGTPALDELRERIFSTTDAAESSIDALGRFTANTGLVSEEAIERWRAAQETATRTTRSIAEDTQRNLNSIYERGIDQTARAITSAITGLQSFADAARQVAFNIINDILQALIRSQIFTLLGGLGVQLPEGITARQFGGPVARGRPYLVGEAGPELFVPGQSGGIVPNNGLGGQTVINFAPVIQVQDRSAVDLALVEAFPLFEERVLARVITESGRPSPLRRT